MYYGISIFNFQSITEHHRPQLVEDAKARLRDDLRILFIIIYDSSPLFKQILANLKYAGLEYLRFHV